MGLEKTARTVSARFLSHTYSKKYWEGRFVTCPIRENLKREKLLLNNYWAALLIPIIGHTCLFQLLDIPAYWAGNKPALPALAAGEAWAKSREYYPIWQKWGLTGGNIFLLRNFFVTLHLVKK